jgi:hypothetical protein
MVGEVLHPVAPYNRFLGSRLVKTTPTLTGGAGAENMERVRYLFPKR